MPPISVAIDRFDLERYVESHGAVEDQDGEWVLQCPSCGKDKLVVNLRKKVWHCWVCQEFETVLASDGPRRRAVSGAGGLIDLIQKLEEVDRRAAVAKIAAAGNVTVDELHHIPELSFHNGIRLSDGMNPTEIPYPGGWARCQDSEVALRYLSYRGISSADVVNFRLFCCQSGIYANRLIFPVYEGRRHVYFQARAMWEPRPGERFRKSLNPPRSLGAAVSTEVLMNLDVARHHSRVVVTEGPIDCIHAGMDAVCSFGKQLSPVQVAKLVRAGVMAVDMMWDADAREAAFAVGMGLASMFDVRVVTLPYGDPGDFSRRELRWFREHAHQLPREARL